MKVVLQRCRRAQVEVDEQVVGRIGHGLVAFVGVTKNDDQKAAEKLARKTVALRIFNDEDGKFNRSAVDVGASILVISNFTVCGDARKGTRPSFSEAATAEPANELYQYYATLLREQIADVQTGEFGANMVVTVENDGPVTIVMDSA